MAYIKICGITDEKEIDCLNANLPDFAGFVLYFPKSKRNIADIERAKSLREKLAPSIKSVAVTVKPTLEQIKSIESAGFSYIQIHGDIEDDILADINIPVLKAFNVKDLEAFQRYSACEKIQGYVFDATVPGSGKVFDWSMLSKLPRDGKLSLVAGGINPDNACEALRCTGLDGVDTSTGVENDNGIGKSSEKIIRFISNVRNME